VFVVRRYRPADRPTVWALNHIPFKGNSADPEAPLDLPLVDGPGHFDDLTDPLAGFVDAGGDFLVVEEAGRVMAMGGIRGNHRGQAEVLRVRVHPARRRRGMGRALMDGLEARAAELGFAELHLDTTIEQPEAIAFYRRLGYEQVGRERFSRWHLLYFSKLTARKPTPPNDATVLSAHNNVHRLGGTVLRPWAPWTHSVNALLRHLEEVGFPGAPRLVGNGRDGEGRQVLTYIEGEQASQGGWSDDGIVEMAKLLRELHDATASFHPPADAVWFPGDLPRHGDDLIIGHGDIGPWNVVVANGGTPVGFIDWEWAGPVRRLDEIADAARLHCQLHADDVAARQNLPPAEVRARHLGLFADAYGLDLADRTQLVDRMIEVAVRGIAYEADEASLTPEFVGPHPMIWGMAWQARGAAWILDHRPMLDQALGVTR
jgi:ribosomal protein S18 acetylase RimI-like enzyme